MGRSAGARLSLESQGWPESTGAGLDVERKEKSGRGNLPRSAPTGHKPFFRGLSENVDDIRHMDSQKLEI
jgi:hypothetical protein